MKLTSESSIIVRWNDQAADWFTLYLKIDQHSYLRNTLMRNTYAFTGISASSWYEVQMQAVFDERLGLLSDIVSITVNSK